MDRLKQFLETSGGILCLLTLLLVAYTVTIIIVALLMPQDNKVYTLLAGLLGNISGAMFTILKANNSDPTAKP